MKVLFASLIGLAMVASPSFADDKTAHPQHPQQGHQQHQQHNPHIKGHHHHKNHFQHRRYGHGFTFKGKTYKHWCYNHHWHGWSYYRWYAPMGCYLYWAPQDLCWYQYVAEQNVYLPCDELVTEDAIPVP